MNTQGPTIRADYQTKEIVSLFENEGLSVDEICLETGIEETAIKTLLAGSSDIYKEQTEKCARVVSDVFNEQDHRLVLQSLKDIAINYADHGNVGAAVRAGIYLHEELTQRNQKKVDCLKDNRINALAGIGMSAILMNERILKAKQAIARAEANGTKTVEINGNENRDY